MVEMARVIQEKVVAKVFSASKSLPWQQEPYTNRVDILCANTRTANRKPIIFCASGPIASCFYKDKRDFFLLLLTG
jgi:hypothetical protein